MRAAWNWAVDRNRIEIVRQALDSLYDYYHVFSRFQEGYDAFARAVENEPSIQIRAYFRLVLLTGCRKRELLRVDWRDVDFDSGLLRIRNTKNDRTHFVPLTEPARQILKSLPRGAASPCVFAGPRKGECMTVGRVDSAWRRIRKTAGCEDARLHDVRRTVGSWLAQAGVSLHLIGHVLNHRSPTTTAIYARLASDSAREVLEDHSRAVLAALTGSAAPSEPANGPSSAREAPEPRRESADACVAP